MRVLTAIAVLLVGGFARADWAPTTVPGTPYDLSPVDGGYLIATTSGVYRVSCSAADAGCGAVATVFTGAAYASAFEVLGCVGGINQSGNSNLSWSPAGCGKTAAVVGSTPTSFRTRTTPSGLTYAAVKSGVAGFALYSNPDVTQVASSWSSVPVGGIASFTQISGSLPALSLAMFDGGEYALTTPQVAVTPRAVVLAGGSLVAPVPVGPTTAVVDGQLLVGPTLGALLVVYGGSPSVLRLMPDVLDGGYVDPVLPPGVTSARLIVEGGTAVSSGFAMAGHTDGGLWGAVPNPARLARDWQPRASSSGQVLKQIECQGPDLCVGLVNAVASNLWVYTNAHVPAVDPTPLNINDGPGNVITVDAGDADGDPVLIIWPGSSGGLTFSSPGVDGRQVTVDSTRSMSCASAMQSVPVTISDGWASHEHVANVNLAVTFVPKPPDAPLVAAPATVAAGAVAISATALAAPPACATTGFSWQLQGDAGGQLVPTGTGTASYQPPATLCQGSGADAVLVAQASGPGGTSPSGVATVHVEPWGLPYVPTFGNPRPAQVAGTTVSYSVDDGGVHACAGLGGFPGVDYLWSPPVIQLDGGRVMTAGSTVTVVTDDCQQGTVDLSVARQVRGVPFDTSDAGSLHVDVTVSLAAITASTPFDSGFAYDGGFATGDFWVGANCPLVRGLTAEVVVSNDAGVVFAGPVSAPVPSPAGGWSVPVTGGCNGGAFTFAATLLQADGGPAGPVDRRSFQTDFQPAAVQGLSAQTLPVTCGAGVQGQLSAVLPPGSCQAVELTWVQQAGPTLLQSRGAVPGSIEVRSSSSEFEALVGAVVTWDVTADAGPGNASTHSGLPVVLATEPFVEIGRRRAPPSGSEDGLVSMAVTLTSHGDCEVRSLQLDETLNGLVFSEGSARLDGEAVAAVSSNGVLRVPAIALGAHATRTLTYSARAPLLTAARPEAVATMRGLTVSTVESPPASASCGCSSPGLSLPWLIGLWALLRTRRRVG